MLQIADQRPSQGSLKLLFGKRAGHLGIKRIGKIKAEAPATSVERVERQPWPVSQKMHAMRQDATRCDQDLPSGIAELVRFDKFNPTAELHELMAFAVSHCCAPSCAMFKVGVTTSAAWRFYLCESHIETGVTSYWGNGCNAMWVMTCGNGELIDRCERDLILALRSDPRVPQHKVQNKSDGNDGPIERDDMYSVYFASEWSHRSHCL